MLRLPWVTILVAWLALGLTCYNMNREPADNLLPCDTSADGVASHSACCNRGDICLASGLCLSTQDSKIGRLFWINGCTDRSFQTDRCFPQLCRVPDQIGIGYILTNFMACDAQNWCCTSDGNSCCSRNNTVILDQGVGIAVRQVPFVTGVSSSSSTSSLPTSSTSSDTSTPTAAIESDSGPSTTGLVAGLAVVATSLLVSVIAIGFLVQRLRKLKRDATIVPQHVPPYNNTPTSLDSSQKGEVAQPKIVSGYSPQAQATQAPQASHELYGHQDPRELYG